MTKAPRLWRVSTFSPLPAVFLQVPPAVRGSEGSFFCEETLSLEFFSLLWRRYKLLSCDTFKEPEAASFFWLRRVFNTLPASPDCHSSRVRARVPKRGWWECLRQCVLETTRSRHMDEDSDGASDSHCESRSLKQTNKKKESILSFSLLFFFVLFHGPVRQGGLTQCIRRKLCMWPSSLFLSWWIMCHLDCVKTVQSGEVVVVKGWIWYQLYIQYVNLNETVDILTEKRNTFVSTTCLQKYKVFFKNGLPCFQTAFI